MRKFLGLGIIVILVIGFLSACDSAENVTEAKDETNEATSESSTKHLEGSVVIDGSGTVYPLMARIAEEYMLTEQENVSVEVGRSGTSAGFQKFLIGNGTDFNDASREIKEEELAMATDLGIDVQELKVALDGLTFVIHPENNWASKMSEEDLIRIFHAEGGVTYWSDINPDWPEEKINTYGPNENHGTYEFFYENILEKADLIDDVDLQQEYSTLVTLISEDKYAIGFFGFGYYVNNQDRLKAVNVDFGDGPVEPSLDTIAEDGAYSTFTRPVFTYLNMNHAKEKPQVLDFSIYLVNHINTFAEESGFAPLPEEEIQSYIDVLENLK